MLALGWRQVWVKHSVIGAELDNGPSRVWLTDHPLSSNDFVLDPERVAKSQLCWHRFLRGAFLRCVPTPPRRHHPQPACVTLHQPAPTLATGVLSGCDGRAWHSRRQMLANVAVIASNVLAMYITILSVAYGVNAEVSSGRQKCPHAAPAAARGCAGAAGSSAEWYGGVGSRRLAAVSRLPPRSQ